MRGNRLSSLTIGAATAGLMLGIFGTAVWSAEHPGWSARTAGELEPLVRMEPVRALPRTELLVLGMRARALLEEGRPWEAWRLLRDRVRGNDAAGAPAVLLAARAAAEWGGWSHARDLLRGREWLEEPEGVEGWYWLARAEEELGNWEAAAAAYRRYLDGGGAEQRGRAFARLGRVLRADGAPGPAAAAFAAAAPLLPEIEDWLRVLQVEQLIEAGDPTAAELATRMTGGSTTVRLRRVLAEAKGWSGAGDRPRALRRLAWEARVLSAQGAHAESGTVQLERARLLRAEGEAREARELLRAVAMEGVVPAAVRREAAAALGEWDDRTAAEELARAAAYEAAGEPGLAARALGAALEAGAPDDPGIRLRRARQLSAARDYGAARRAFLEVAPRLSDPALAADAELHAARSLYRAGGSRDESRAIAELKEIVRRYPGTAAAGSASYLLGDVSSTLELALGHYERAAAVHASPDAREALYRVGDRSLRLKRPQSALRAWEEYVARYPTGERTAEVAYEAARLHEAAGREDRARAMYAAAMLADPISYAAFRAGEHLGAHPLDAVLAEPRHWPGLASDPLDARVVLERLDRLEQAGLAGEWEMERDAAIRGFARRPAALVALAEGLRDRGHPVTGIRIGRDLLAQRDGRWDERLLKLHFPFLYRDLIRREAERADVDPALFAGLIRQESTFRPAARSWVGATGLGQIMPATGKWLAPSIGIEHYEPRLLEVPEVNLRMGARYLGDLMERFDGAADLALAGYNAGPSRADRWRRTIYRRGTDAFRDAIPFDETRHYVKVVLRNASIYERLYGL